MPFLLETPHILRGDAKAAKEETPQNMEALKKELRGTNAMAEKIIAVG